MQFINLEGGGATGTRGGKGRIDDRQLMKERRGAERCVGWRVYYIALNSSMA